MTGVKVTDDSSALEAIEAFLYTIPWVVGIVGIWFMISYFTNASMVRNATGAKPLERRENPRIYNIVENLTMTCGMPMPKINIIDDPQLNAFASGIDEKSYTVTVTTGICNRLNDDELAGVIGHELTHIRNRDTRLLIISIIFVGIMSVFVGRLFREEAGKGLCAGFVTRIDADLLGLFVVEAHQLLASGYSHGIDVAQLLAQMRQEVVRSACGRGVEVVAEFGKASTA